MSRNDLIEKINKEIEWLRSEYEQIRHNLEMQSLADSLLNSIVRLHVLLRETILT